MSKIRMFFVNLFLNAFRHIGSIVLSVILIVVGLLWSRVCLYIGLGLLACNVIVALIGAIRMQRVMLRLRDVDLSNEDPEVQEMMEKFMGDPNAYMAEIMGRQEEHCALHGEELLTLSDDDLFEAVFMQNMEIITDAEDADRELELLAGARRVVQILNTFDAEIQNGGLCQFFVNSSRDMAPFVTDALTTVGAEEHCRLFADFVTSNHIDTTDLNSFKVFSVRGFRRQAKRYDFDAFDEAYYELPPLQDKVVAYIKANIQEF